MDFEHDFMKAQIYTSSHVTITCVTSYRMISLYDGQCEIMGVKSCFDCDSTQQENYPGYYPHGLLPAMVVTPLEGLLPRGSNV